MENDVAVSIEGVYKDFLLPNERNNSLKSHIVHPLKRRTFEKQHALKGINLEIKKGEFFGIVGRNGSGKSTLLKIIAGIYQPTKGKVKVHGKLVPFIELGVGFNPELSGRDNVYLNGALLGFSKKEIDEMYVDIVDFAELAEHMDQKLKNYSSGMQVRLAFSVAVRAKADILLIDEVLAVGDTDFQRKCYDYFKKLKKERVTVVFVSHNMNAVSEYCDRAALIDENSIKKIGSPKNIAQDYNLLFIDNAFESAQTEDKKSNRWGTKQAEIKNVNVSEASDNILVKVKVKANKAIDKVIYGMHINAADGSEIMAVNNQYLKEPDIDKLKVGQTVDISWKILNIFSEGNYSLAITLVSSSGEVYDWFNDAAKFSLKRETRSTTSIMPPIEITLKYNAE